MQAYPIQYLHTFINLRRSFRQNKTTCPYIYIYPFVLSGSGYSLCGDTFAVTLHNSFPRPPSVPGQFITTPHSFGLPLSKFIQTRHLRHPLCPGSQIPLSPSDTCPPLWRCGEYPPISAKHVSMRKTVPVKNLLIHISVQYFYSFYANIPIVWAVTIFTKK